jgi:hypothetical protein
MILMMVHRAVRSSVESCARMCYGTGSQLFWLVELFVCLSCPVFLFGLEKTPTSLCALVLGVLAIYITTPRVGKIIFSRFRNEISSCHNATITTRFCVLVGAGGAGLSCSTRQSSSTRCTQHHPPTTSQPPQGSASQSVPVHVQVLVPDTGPTRDSKRVRAPSGLCKWV